MSDTLKNDLLVLTGLIFMGFSLGYALIKTGIELKNPIKENNKFYTTGSDTFINGCIIYEQEKK